MFKGSRGSICQRQELPFPITPKQAPIFNIMGIKQAARRVTRRPFPKRELIVPPATTTKAITSTIVDAMTCPKCGTFDKSGRVSCCAPGGAWFKHCGGADNRNVDHRWFEGLEACKRKFKSDNG